MTRPAGRLPLVAAAAIALAGMLLAAPPAGADGALAPRDRAAIVRALDVFVPAAVGRHHPLAARAVASPRLRGAVSRAEWASGTLPVVPFPVAGRRFGGWRLRWAHPHAVSFDLILHPRPGSHLGGEAYTVVMRRIGGRWLVDSFTPVASFAAPGGEANITAEPDFGPHSKGSYDEGKPSPYLILVPVAIVVVPLAGLALAGAVLWARRRSPRSAPDTAADAEWQRALRGPHTR